MSKASSRGILFSLDGFMTKALFFTFTFALSRTKLECSYGSCFLVFLMTGIAALAACSCAMVIERYIDSTDWSASSKLSALNRF